VGTGVPKSLMSCFLESGRDFLHLHVRPSVNYYYRIPATLLINTGEKNEAKNM
jgi:hypothetical protein